MKYLCLICADTWMERMSESDAQKHYDDYQDFTEDLRDSGHYLDCNRLQPPETAVTVRMRGGQLSTTDGPYAETREQLGGYYLLEAADLNEAIHLASKIPGAEIGCVEIRPIAEDEATLKALGRAGS
jgi:hypothetical protein